MKSLGKTEQLFYYSEMLDFVYGNLLICNIGESVKIEYCNSSTYYLYLMAVRQNNVMW